MIFTWKDQEITLLSAGPKKTATLFEFRDRDREGPIGNGDLASLMVYGTDGRQKGFTARALQPLSPLTSNSQFVGAIPYSEPNEGIITFTNIALVPQEDVPV